MKKSTLQEVQSDELDEKLEGFRVEIYKALLSCRLKGIEQVDVIFHKSSAGTLPKFEIRRVLEDSDVDSETLYRNVMEVVSFDKEELQEIREDTNNE